MRLSPRSQKGDHDYPSVDEHRLHRRAFLRALGGAALGVAAGRLLAQDATNPVKKTLAEQVKDLTAKLGNEDFRVRRQATATLIAIGKGAGKDKVADAKAKALVLAALEPLKKAKDPEIAQRAKSIITTLTPKPKPPPPPHILRGKVIQVKGRRG